MEVFFEVQSTIKLNAKISRRGTWSDDFIEELKAEIICGFFVKAMDEKEI